MQFTPILRSMLLILASAAALLHSTLSSSTPLVPAGRLGPAPQNGVWALLPSDCTPPTALDIATWAKCAQPLGFVDDEVAALERPGPGKRATADQFYSIGRTRYALAAPVKADAPVVVQVDVPMVFSHTFLYLAVNPKAVDAAGRFTEADVWPVACLSEGEGGCNAADLATVQTQAASAPTDPVRLYRLMRVMETAPPVEPTPTSPSVSPITPAPIDQAPLPPVVVTPPPGMR